MSPMASKGSPRGRPSAASRPTGAASPSRVGSRRAARATEPREKPKRVEIATADALGGGEEAKKQEEEANAASFAKAANNHVGIWGRGLSRPVGCNVNCY